MGLAILANEMDEIIAMDTPDRQLIALIDVERRLMGIFSQRLSRQFIITLIEDGTLEGRKVARKWWIFSDSLERWLRTLRTPEVP